MMDNFRSVKKLRLDPFIPEVALLNRHLERKAKVEPQNEQIKRGKSTRRKKGG